MKDGRFRLLLPAVPVVDGVEPADLGVPATAAIPGSIHSKTAAPRSWGRSQIRWSRSSCCMGRPWPVPVQGPRSEGEFSGDLSVALRQAAHGELAGGARIRASRHLGSAAYGSPWTPGFDGSASGSMGLDGPPIQEVCARAVHPVSRRAPLRPDALR